MKVSISKTGKLDRLDTHMGPRSGTDISECEDCPESMENCTKSRSRCGGKTGSLSGLTSINNPTVMIGRGTKRKMRAK